MKPLKAYLNFLSYRRNRDRGLPMVDNYPVMAFVDPTLFCNLRCPACPTGSHAGLRPRATLGWDLYQQFMDEVGDYLFKLYLYNLGEPLLHKQTPEMIELAKAKDIFVMVSSNLSIELSDEYLLRLVQSGPDVLVVAMDGVTPESYQQYRRGGDFDLVRTNMQRIQAIKKQLNSSTPHVMWQFLVFQHNEHEVETVKREYKAWGADEYCIGGAYMPLGGQGLFPSSRPEYDIYDSKHYHRQKSVQALMERKVCSWLYGVTVLHPNGYVSPCSYTAAEKDDFGHLSPGQSFTSVWNGPRYIQARSLSAQRSACWQGSDSWEEIGTRMDGRAMGVKTEPGQLICQRCPVPFLQDVVDHELTFKEEELFDFIERQFELSPEEQSRLDSLKSTV